MNPPLSGKQQRENYKFLFDELRKTVAARKDQRRKEQSHQQKMKQLDEKHTQKMDVPPMRGMPMNPEAGPTDKIPALLTKGEAVIPRKAAQNPQNKPLIKAMVREGRSDVNMSVPKPGYMCGTTNVKGYANGTDYVAMQDEYGRYIDAPVIPDAQYEAQGMQENYTSSAMAQQSPEIPLPPLNQEYNKTEVVPAEAPELNPAGEFAGVEGSGYAIETTKQVPMTTSEITNTIQKETNNLLDKNSKGNLSISESDKLNQLQADQKIISDSISKEVPPTASSENTIASRYNNPGNLRFGGKLDSKTNTYVDTGKRLEGQIGVDAKTGFAIFQDDSFGRSALENQIRLDTQERGLTVEQFTNKYAPASDNNNPKQYADIISKELGIKPSDKIPSDKIRQVADIITRVESGGKYQPSKAGVPQVKTDALVPPVPQSQRDAQDMEDGKIYQNEEQVKGTLEKYGDVIVSGIQDVWNTIKDPKELGNFISSFVKDTLGFNGRDAARFGLLVAGSRAIGYNPTQAVRYAANYTLKTSDARETAKNLANTQKEIAGMKEKADLKKAMITKGYIQKGGKYFYPPTKGTPQSYTVDNGKDRGKEIYFYEYTDERGNKTLGDANGVPIEQYAEKYGQPIVKMQDYHRPEVQAVKRNEYTNNLSKAIEDMKKENLGDKTKKGNINDSWGKLPNSAVMSNQLVNTSEKYGLNLAYGQDQRVSDLAIKQAAEDAVREAKGSDVRIEDVSYQFEKQMLVKGVGPTEGLYKNSSNKPIQAADRTSNFKQVEAKLGGDRKEVINKFNIWADNFRSNPELQKKWEATQSRSGFMRYVENELKQMK